MLHRTNSQEVDAHTQFQILIYNDKCHNIDGK